MLQGSIFNAIDKSCFVSELKNRFYWKDLNMNVLVVGSGTVESTEIIEEYSKTSDLIICADGGSRYLNQAGIKPHILVGDLIQLI